MNELRQLLEKFDIKPTKALGQNFLHRTDVIETIADASGSGNFALEIGAGPAILSRCLCDRFERVVTVEIDRSLKEITDYVLLDCKNHTMRYSDIMRVDLGEYSELAPITVVGNLPYNITSDILEKLLLSHDLIGKAVIMIQKEVAERISAGPKDDGYRAMSVLVQYFCDVSTVIDVTPDCFIPPPHVQSRVIALDFKSDLPFDSENERKFIKFVKKVFSQRRKFLTAIFQSTEQKQECIKALEKLGFSDKTRGEQLSPCQFAELFRELYINKNEIFVL